MPSWAAMSFHAFLLVHCNRGGGYAWDKDSLSAVLYVEFDYICTDSMRVHHVRYAPVILRYSQN